MLLVISHPPEQAIKLMLSTIAALYSYFQQKKHIYCVMSELKDFVNISEDN